MEGFHTDTGVPLTAVSKLARGRQCHLRGGVRAARVRGGRICQAQWHPPHGIVTTDK